MANSDQSSGSVRAAVYLATDQERKVAKDVLGSLEPEAGDSFSGVIEGELDPSQVQRLHDAGLVVELIAPSSAAAPEPPGGAARRLADSAEAIDDLRDQANVTRAGGLVPSEEEALPLDAYNLDLSGPITREQRLELDALGVDIAAFEPGFGYRTLLSREQYAKVRALPYVAAVNRYRFSQTVTPGLLDAVAEAEAGEGEDDGPGLLSSGEEGASATETFDCLLHREDDRKEVRKLIEAVPGTEILATTNLRIRFRTEPDAPLLATLAARPEVRQLSVYREPTL